MSRIRAVSYVAGFGSKVTYAYDSRGRLARQTIDGSSHRLRVHQVRTARLGRVERPTIPASTDPKRIMDAIRSLNGMTVTFGDTTDVYSSSWEFLKSYDEVTSGNYDYKNT